jgi:cytochrome c
MHLFFLLMIGILPAQSEASRNQGADLYLENCAGCHGKTGLGSGNIPRLAQGRVQQMSVGEIFGRVEKASFVIDS